jgi:2,4-dienoyl-CoA reductase-like NADH-dependent reductase (Old Yellow Enzyme family)
MPVVDLSTLPPLERAEKSLLFQPLTLGSMTVKHRIALAPLTRNRGKVSGAVKGTWYPWQIQEDYYVQRATDGGMLISEAFPVSLQAAGKGMINVPGIWTEEQKDAWKPIVENVKKAGAVFVAQRESGVQQRRKHPAGSSRCYGSLTPTVFHGGRAVGHGLERAVSSSATRVENTLGGGPGDVPDEMTLDDIKRTIDDYVQSAKNAIEAGFDGVEIHGGNGYRECATGLPAVCPSPPLPSPPLLPSFPLHPFTSSRPRILAASPPRLLASSASLPVSREYGMLAAALTRTL